MQPSARGPAGGPSIGPFKRYGRYTLVKKLATGGMAEIWLARQRGLADFKRFVVIKKILSHLSAQETFVKMFLDEARTSAQLNHPNIVQVYDLGREGESYFIAMEFINGENLAAVAWRGKKRNDPIPVPFAARVLADACKGLHYAHHLKGADGAPLSIVHRDISPQNLLLTYDGETKVVDFGIAKAASRSEATKTGMLKGKFSYMSPEQCQGAPIDMRSDIFALGILLYELTTGTRLFKHESELMILEMITKREVVSPREVNPEIPEELDRIVMRALRKDPNDRFQTAQEMQLALEEYIRRSGGPASSTELSVYMRALFQDHLEEKRQLLEIAARDDLNEVGFTEEETEQARASQRRVVHGLPPGQLRPPHATGSNPQTGAMYPPHATGSGPGMPYPPHAGASGMYPPHATGSGGMYPPHAVGSMHGYPGSQYGQQPWPQQQEEERQRWVARLVILGALLVIAFASFILYRQLVDKEEISTATFDAGQSTVQGPIRVGDLKLETKPNGADIYLDGVPMKISDGQIAKTPSDLQRLQYGKTFEIRFEKKGYYPAKRVVLMGGGTDGTTIREELRAFDGTLIVEVRGKARDATILLDGEGAGRGPILTKALPGNREIAIAASHPTYRCTADRERVFLAPNTTERVMITCKTKPRRDPRRPPPVRRTPPPPPASGGCSDVTGKATFGSKPFGATVYINGKKIGTTPINAHLLPSNCLLKVRAVWPDGTERNETIKLQPNKNHIFRLDRPS